MSGSRFAVVDLPLDSRQPSLRPARGLVEISVERGSGPAPHPVVVDFLSPQLQHRTRSGTNSELIVKAVGVKPAERAGVLIYDFTAGLGTDAFLLASAGYTVVGFERDVRVHEILQDGLRRFQEAFPQRELPLEFRCENAVDSVAAAISKSDGRRPMSVIIDPMFESESTQAKSLPKKEMALLRKMLPVSSKDEIRDLFRAAVSVATSRVIVKRPMGAEEIVEPIDWGRALKPRRLEGKTARFDIYSCRS